MEKELKALLGKFSVAQSVVAFLEARKKEIVWMMLIIKEGTD